MVTCKRVAGSGKAQVHGRGARLKARLMEIYRFGLEKIKFVNLYRSVKWLARVSGTVAKGSAMEGALV